MSRKLANVLVANGAAVFLVGMLAGFPFAFILLGKIEVWPIPVSAPVSMPGDVRGWRMAHLEGILNGLTLLAVAALGPHLPLTERSARRAVWALVIMAWGNQIASLIGPLNSVRGLAFGGSVANSATYLLFIAAIFGVFVGMGTVLKGSLTALRSAPAGEDGRTETHR